MKHFVVGLFVTFCCNSLKAQHQIIGEITHNSNIEKVYLKTFKGLHFKLVDSVLVTNDTFTLNLPPSNDIIYLDTNEDPKFYLKLYNTEGKTVLTYNADSKEFKLSSSAKNVGFFNYNNLLKPFEDKLQLLGTKRSKFYNRSVSSMTIDDQEELKLISLQQHELKHEVYKLKLNFIANNLNNSFSNEVLNEIYKKEFEDEFLEDYGLIIEKLSKSQKKEDRYQKLIQFYNEHEFLLSGNKIQDFEVLDVNGIKQTLYSNLGKYTIIDFWASWCGPCRIENPNLVALYKKYKAKGLQIVGVSLDHKEEAWKKAIEKDQLAWVQLSNLKGWNDPIATQFKIHSIPSMLLVDRKGKIVARNLKGKELNQKLLEIFK